MEIQFLGATGTVTGSKYLVRAADKQVLVDCGLFQGYKQLRLRNWGRFPVDPKSIDAIAVRAVRRVQLGGRNALGGRCIASLSPVCSARRNISP